MTIAIQGMLGSFHHQAALKIYGPNIKILPKKTFREVFVAVNENESDAGVVAVENSIFGTIQETYRLLDNYNFWVSGQVILPIKHMLIGVPGAKIEDVRTVHSQNMAIEQCRYTLTDLLTDVKFLEENDTALSVSIIKENGDVSHAAIASSLAAELNECPILKHDIQDTDDNATRFLTFVKTRPAQDGGDWSKTMIRLCTGHTSGSLYTALGVIAKEGVNITKLESWPLKGDKWHYSFYIDLDIGSNSQSFFRIKNEIEKLGNTVDVIGSFAL